MRQRKLAQSIEDEIPHSFTQTLEIAIEVLERRSFDDRIQSAHAALEAKRKSKVVEERKKKQSAQVGIAKQQQKVCPFCDVKRRVLPAA